MSSLIEVSGLAKAFGDKHVLKGVGFTAEEGTATALLGPSGSGKTTVLRSMNVLETPEAGLVRIADASVDFGSLPGDKRERRRQIAALRSRSAMVFQSHNLFPHMTVLENLVEGPVQVQQRDQDEAVADARGLLAQVGLADREDTYPAEPEQPPARLEHQSADGRSLVLDEKATMRGECLTHRLERLLQKQVRGDRLTRGRMRS